MSAQFASTADMADKTAAFDSIGPDLYAFTAEGDPDSGVIVGEDGVIVVDAQATPVMARQVIERVAKVTDQPIKYVLLAHYHAVRVLGATLYGADPDAACLAQMQALRALPDAKAAELDTRLVLILANHIGDLDVLKEAIAPAGRAVWP